MFVESGLEARGPCFGKCKFEDNNLSWVHGFGQISGI